MAFTKQQMISAMDGLVDESNRLREQFLADYELWTGDFAAWLKACESTLEIIFGSSSDALVSFRAIHFTPPADQQFTNELETLKAKYLWYDSGLRFAQSTLIGFRYTVDRFAAEEAARQSPFVFISHGGPDRNHVDVAAAFLTALGLSPVVVADLPNLNLSIKEKVRYYMSICAGGIALATLDDEVSAGVSRTRPNVENEIGMMQTMPNIGARIIYMKEDGVQFASNYSEKVWIPFERSLVHKSLIPLTKELRAFGFLV